MLVAGIGNVLLGDDGFGPEVVRRLAGQHDFPEEVRIVDYGIRGLHLAYDLLDPWDGLILIDALPDRGDPSRIVVLELGAEDVPAGGQVDAHSMDPATVLASLAALGGKVPQITLLVGCQVTDVDERIGLTPPVEQAVDEAVRTVQALLTRELTRAEVS
ncbi:hydrogenase maturation protease [Modestobacter sp. DSM 44400]|nr:hydrogenase maturation protease [Modestobacter sp. DSM 44400]